MIEIRHLRKEYKAATPLRDVNVTIRDGDIISVIGPSGTGKSTLIRCLNMLETPTSGQILIDGTDITDKKCDISRIRKKMGMVFQSFNLFGHLTVIENIMRPQMDLLGTDRQTAYDNAIRLLRTVGLEDRAMRYPDMLSGGQKQRVAIARTLSMDPDIILFDEPTSALDPTMVGEVQSVIRALAKTGKTMLIVTHEMKFAREICNRVFYMDEGGIYEDGTPEQVFDDPLKERTRRFVRRLKVFEAKIDSPGFDFAGNFSDLSQFGYKNQIPPNAVSRLQSCFEEVCQQLLLPKLPEPRISFAIEYDESSSMITVILLYNGEPFDPRCSDNEISLKIFGSIAQDVEYSVCSEEGYANRFVFRIRS